MTPPTRWLGFPGIAGAALLAIIVTLPAQAPTDARRQWEVLNGLSTDAYQAGNYSKGISLAEQALRLARQTFGERDPQIFTSLNNLAVLYRAQGRYSEAESRQNEALQGRREVLGSRHPDTLTSLNDLAVLYRAQGRYSEAESRQNEALLHKAVDQGL
jgi:tetratricopeptide (TPR) repeat protein